jgi:hypothetical protein
MGNTNLGAAREAKFDEFYTQYHDIEKEMNAYLDFNKDVFRDKIVLLPCDDPEWSNFTKYFAQNFERLGLKKLISTSYAPDSKPQQLDLQLTLFETASPKFDKVKARANGKIYTLTRDTTGDQKVNVEDLEWEYLKGDGDFRSPEVSALRDEADIIITNPPFSLFREFLEWIVIADKKLVILGNKNAITYKEVFPLIKENKMWLGSTPMSVDLMFRVPESMQAQLVAAGKEGSAWRRIDGEVMGRSTSAWFTSLDHGRRHEPLELMTEQDNITFSKHKGVKGVGYQKYDNYDAIEVPFTDAIPADYGGVMGVPISFLSKHNPDQFEIVGMAKRGAGDPALKSKVYTIADAPNYSDLNAGPVLVTPTGMINTYPRILIRHKRAS